MSICVNMRCSKWAVAHRAVKMMVLAMAGPVSSSDDGDACRFLDGLPPFRRGFSFLGGGAIKAASISAGGWCRRYTRYGSRI